MKKYIRFFTAFLLLFTYITSVSVFAVSYDDDEYIWVLTDIVEYPKNDAIDDYNSLNFGVFNVAISSSPGKYSFFHNYLGEDMEQGGEGRLLKKGDFASSQVSFSSPPKLIGYGETVELSLIIEITEDNTYDKKYEFLGTRAAAFFDKAVGRPDIPSSEAIYFLEDEENEQGTFVGTREGSKTYINTKVFTTAPRGRTEGQRIAICLSAEGIIKVGTKYVYEWLPAGSANQSTVWGYSDRESVLEGITGDVLYREADANDYAPVAKGSSLFEGDRIKTSGDGSCVIRFNDKSYITVGGSSEIMLYDTVENNTRIKLLRGRAWAYMQPVVTDGSFRMEMEYAVLRVKGTIFAVEESESGSTVWMFTGYAIFSSTVNGELIELAAGKKATFDINGELKVENFRITEEIEVWSIPFSAIVEDGEFSRVYLFIYFLIGLAAFTLICIIIMSRLKKRRSRRKIAEGVPGEGHCVFCGKPLPSGSVFCPYCGAAVKRKKDDGV